MTYMELKAEQSKFDVKKHGGFFAFGKEHFEKNRIGDPPYVHIGAGLFVAQKTSQELIDAFSQHIRDCKEKVKNAYTPKEVFDYEYSNYECDVSRNVSQPCKWVEHFFGFEELEKLSKQKSKKAYMIKAFIEEQKRKKGIK